MTRLRRALGPPPDTISFPRPSMGPTALLESATYQPRTRSHPS
jgi:hypothetical protein